MPHMEGHSGDGKVLDTFITGYKGAKSIAYGQVSVGTSRIKVVDRNEKRRTVLVRNAGSTDVFIGDEFVTTINGMPVPSGTEKVLEYVGELWAVVASGTEDLRWLTEQD